MGAHEHGLTGTGHPAAEHGHRSGAGHRQTLAAVLAISAAILAAEVAGAIVSGSLALLADAGHVLTDVAGLTLALVASLLASRPATAVRTWGYRRAEILAAAAQAAVLLAVGIFVLVEGVRRLITAPQVSAGPMVVFGAVGLAGNVISIMLLARVRDGNLNTRAALLEVANDALGSVAVLVAAGIIALSGWTRADAVVSILIALLIMPRTWRLLRESVDVLLESVPKGMDVAGIRTHILDVPRVHDVHDLHVSSVASDLPVLTAHVVVDESCFHDGNLPGLLDELQQCLAGHFDVQHSTFQFEPAGHLKHEGATHA